MLMYGTAGAQWRKTHGWKSRRGVWGNFEYMGIVYPDGKGCRCWRIISSAKKGETITFMEVQGLRKKAFLGKSDTTAVLRSSEEAYRIDGGYPRDYDLFELHSRLGVWYRRKPFCSMDGAGNIHFTHENRTAWKEGVMQAAKPLVTSSLERSMARRKYRGATK